MKINVKRLSDGAVIEIYESDFDESKHERIPSSVGDMTPEGFAAMQAEATGSAIRQILEALGVGKPVGKPATGTPRDPNGDDDDGDDQDPEARAYGEAVRAIPAWERQYRRLPGDERAVRSPEGDVRTWRFLKAHMERDFATMRQVIAEDEGIQRIVRAQRALGTGGASAGDLLPTPLSDLITLKRDKIERIQPRALTVTSVSQTLDMPREDTVGAVAGVAENADIGETDSTFTELNLSKKKVGRLVRTSKELLADVSGAFSLATILSNQAARKLAVYHDLQEAEDGDGVGTNYTESLIEASISTVTATGALDRDLILTVLYGLPDEYRDSPGVVWMANAAMVEIIGKLEDANGRPLYSTANAPAVPVGDVNAPAGVVNVVEGKPLIQVPFATNILMIGLLSEGFTVLMDGGIRVESTTEADDVFKKDQMMWKFVERRDCGVNNPEAFRKSSGVFT